MLFSKVESSVWRWFTGSTTRGLVAPHFSKWRGLPLTVLHHMSIYVSKLFFHPQMRFSHVHDYWGSEVSPTLGCSIEISRDIYILIGRAKRAPHWGVQSRFRVIGERDTLRSVQLRIADIYITRKMVPIC